MNQEELKKLVHYDPETGVFISLVNRNKLKIGDILGCKRPDNYFQIRINNVIYLAHRLAFFYMTGSMPKEVDHINLDKSDNKFTNLRIATRTQNTGNVKLRSTNTSGYRGVHFHKRAGKWVSEITINGKNRYLGLYKFPEEAYVVYCEAAKKHFGEYARLA